MNVWSKQTINLPFSVYGKLNMQFITECECHRPPHRRTQMCKLLLGRIAVLRIYMWPIVTDQVA